MEDTECSWYEPSCTLHWFQDEFKALFVWLYDCLLSGLAKIIELIPVPDFLANLQSILMSPTVSWFLEPFNITYGLSAMVVAYIARFILRRIPFIG